MWPSLLLLRGLGACQVVCGVVAVWLGALEVVTAWTPYPGVSALPVGCGVMFVMVGALGLFFALDDSCAVCTMGLLTVQSTLNCLLLAPLACTSAVLGAIHTSQTRTRNGDTSIHDWHLHLEIGIICACVLEAAVAGTTAMMCGCCEILGCQNSLNVETAVPKATPQQKTFRDREVFRTNIPAAYYRGSPTSLGHRPDKQKPAVFQRSNEISLNVIPPKRPGSKPFLGSADISSDTLPSTVIHPRTILEELESFTHASVPETASSVETSTPEAPLPGSTRDCIEQTTSDVQTLPTFMEKATEADGDEESESPKPPAFLKPLDSARIPPRLVRNKIGPEYIGSITSFFSLDGSPADSSRVTDTSEIAAKSEHGSPVRKLLPPPPVLNNSTGRPSGRSLSNSDFYQSNSWRSKDVFSLESTKTKDLTSPQCADVHTFMLRGHLLETFHGGEVIPANTVTKLAPEDDSNDPNVNDDAAPASLTTKADICCTSGGGTRSRIPSAGSLLDGRSSKLTMVSEEFLVSLDAVDRELDEAETLITSDNRRQSLSVGRSLSSPVASEVDCGMTDVLTSPGSSEMDDVDEHIEAAETLIQMYEATEALQKAMSLRNLQALETAITAVQKAGVEDRVKQQMNRANKLLLSLRQLEKLKQEVLKVRQSTVSEIRSYNKPHPAVRTVMTAVYLLLGTREKDTENWQSVQVLLSKAGTEGLKRRVSACNVAKIPVAVANRCKQFLGKYSLAEIRDVSAGAATLYLWATGVVQEVRDRAREQRQLQFTSTNSTTADIKKTD